MRADAVDDDDLPDRRATLARLARASVPWLSIAVLLVAWELCVRGFRIPDYLLPAPSEVWSQTSDGAGRR